MPFKLGLRVGWVLYIDRGTVKYFCTKTDAEHHAFSIRNYKEEGKFRKAVISFGF